MTSILAFVFVLGVLIFVHELGHFMMARRIGVRVLTFSLGFGPKMLSFRRGDTEYCISAIPLGGYVKMAGETPEDARTGSLGRVPVEIEVAAVPGARDGPGDEPRLAVIVMAIVLLQGARFPRSRISRPWSVASSRIRSRRPRHPGRRPHRQRRWQGRVELEAVLLWSSPRANRPVRSGIERDGKRIEREVVPAAVDRYETGAIGVLPVMHPQIAETRVGQPGAEGGLHPGDVIMAAGGEANVSRERLIELIKAHDGKPLALNVVRGGAPQTITVVPRKYRRRRA